MTQLWVKTHGGNWLRADQIIEIGVEPVHESGPHDDSSGAEVIAQLAVTTGSGNWDYDRGTGAVGPSARILARCPDGATAQRIADQLVLILLSAGKNAQITFEEDQVLLRPVHEGTSYDTPYNGRTLDPC